MDLKYLNSLGVSGAPAGDILRLWLGTSSAEDELEDKPELIYGFFWAFPRVSSSPAEAPDLDVTAMKATSYMVIGSCSGSVFKASFPTPHNILRNL